MSQIGTVFSVCIEFFYLEIFKFMKIKLRNIIRFNLKAICLLGILQTQIVLADDFRAISKLPNCPASERDPAENDTSAWNNCWGQYQHVSANGEKFVFEGEFVSGRMNGRGRVAFYARGESRPSGFMYVGDFKDGNYHGVGTYIHKGDEKTYGKRVGQFKNGRFDGLGVDYAADGEVISEGMWENDQLIKELKTPFSK